MLATVQTTFSNVIIPIGLGVVENSGLFLARNFEKVDFVYNSIQTLLTEKADKNPQFFTKFFSKRNIRLCTDTLSLVCTSGFAWYQLMKVTYKIDSILLNAGGLWAGVALTVLSVGTAWALRLVFKHKIHVLPENLEKKENISFSWPQSEKFKQTLYVARIVSNIALACLYPLNPFFVMNAALELYSVTALLNHQWIVYRYEHEIELSDEIKSRIDRISVVYGFLMQKVSDTIPENKKSCAICQDEMTPKNATYFCDDHLFHKTCIISRIKDLVRSLHSSFEIAQRTEVIHYYHNEIKINTSEYTLSAQSSNKPSCPECRKAFSYPIMGVRAHDISLKWWVPTKILWLN